MGREAFISFLVVYLRSLSSGRLCLDTNDLVGDIPPELTDATNLEELILHHNSFSGSIPRNIGALVHLRDLWLNSNKLTGSKFAALNCT